MDRASESYIDAIYYHEMFHSNACWKTSSMVDRELKKIRSKSAKLNALKENIRMRVLGLGWKDLATPWSRDSRELTPDQLTDHLKKIISYQRTRGIPKNPPVDLPRQKMLPTLGTKTSTLSLIEKKYNDQSDKFETDWKNERAERELAGIGDRYNNMQPLYMTSVDKKTNRQEARCLL